MAFLQVLVAMVGQKRTRDALFSRQSPLLPTLQSHWQPFEISRRGLSASQNKRVGCLSSTWSTGIMSLAPHIIQCQKWFQGVESGLRSKPWSPLGMLSKPKPNPQKVFSRVENYRQQDQEALRIPEKIDSPRKISKIHCS